MQFRKIKTEKGHSARKFKKQLVRRFPGSEELPHYTPQNYIYTLVLSLNLKTKGKIDLIKRDNQGKYILLKIP